MKKAVIENLFPTPIYMTNIDRSFTKQELQFVDNQKNKCSKNSGNINTKDNYILNRKEFKNVKKFLDQCCQDYLEKIISPKNNIELYITQSWLNLCKKDQYHHGHKHPNSILSGVFYLQTVDDDCISFDNTHRVDQIRPSIRDFNDYNSSLYNLPIEKNMLVIFPSSLMHSVPPVKKDQVRVSLAFNTFIKGELGKDEQLAKVII